MPARSVGCMLLWACAGVILVFLGSCAQLPPVASAALPPIPAGEARVWFYRIYDPTESLGRPYLRMNESIIGISNQGGAFDRDVPAGWYHITVDSYGRDLYQFADVALASGQQIYIKVLSLRSWTEWRPGVGRDTFYVALIPSELARAEIAGYVLLGDG
jgi:hypothetical protein